MQKHYLQKGNWVLAFVLLSTVMTYAQVKIGNNPTNINSSALLHLENRSTQSKGFILPEVDLPRTDGPNMGPGTVNPSQTAVRGMMVYNKKVDVVGTATYPASGIGIYTFDGTGWVFGGIPSGGASGQVLSKTATGLQWSTPGAGVMTYQVGSPTNAGAYIKASGPGVTLSVNTTTQTATITIPSGVELFSVRLYDMNANGVSGSYGMSPASNYLNIRFEYTGRTVSYTTTTIPQVQVLLDGIPSVIMDTYGTGYPRQYEINMGPVGGNFFSVNIPLMDPATLGNKWTVMLNF